jgi:tetratricopeptide (TPR) repeat protein
LYKKSDISESEFNMLASFFTGIFSVFVYALTNFPFSITPVAATMFVLFGITEVYKEEFKQVPGKRTSAFTFIVLVAIWIFLINNVVMPRFSSDITRREGDIAGSSGDYKAAIEKYEEAIRQDYYHSEMTAYDLGEVYRKLGQIDKAIKSYEISIALRNYGEVYNDIGNCYYLKNDVKNTLNYWKIAARLGLPDAKSQEQLIKNLRILDKSN